MERRTFIGNAALSGALLVNPLQAAIKSPGVTGPLKITGFKIHKTSVRWRSMLFLEIETDGGITGIGEGSIFKRTKLCEEAIRALEPYFVGKDPSGIEQHWENMYFKNGRWRHGVLLQTAISAIDMALWDLEGKRLGVPVFRLMGGPLRTSLHAYHTHIDNLAKDGSPEALVDVVLEAKAKGWDMVKWGPRNIAPEIQSIRKETAKLAAVRKAVGNEFELSLDIIETCKTERSALRYANAFAPYKPIFLEEPTWRENPAAMTELAMKSPVAIASGEGLIDVFEFKQLLDAKGAVIIQPDILHCGGITMMRKIANLAEIYGVEIAPHQCKGPIAHMASLSVMANSRNFLSQEWEAIDDELFKELTYGTYPTQQNGMISMPEAPGLGIKVNFEEFKRRFPFNTQMG
jgi:galactonate dehydratase